jgi:ABC-type uncharacterized transport system substrate-binding protein
MNRVPTVILTWAVLLSATIATLSPQAAKAHPHILIDAHTEIVFNAAGQVTEVTNVWDFDDAFSAFAIQGYDRNDDGILTRQELQPLAEINLKSLADYDYFTRMTVDGKSIPFGHPRAYFDVFKNEKLTLHFTLPLARPLDVHGKTLQVNVYDPAYFAAVTFANDHPVELVGASAGCESVVHRPEPLDGATASRLAVIPASQRELPPELYAITNKLVNATRVTCK